MDVITEDEEARISHASGSPLGAMYGELTPEGAACVLAWLRPRHGDVLYDLGSGAGRFAMQCALELPFVSVRGIELAESRHAVARAAAERIALPNVSFCNGDFLQADLSDATLVYSGNLVFHSNFLARLGAVLSRLPQLRTIASLRRFPPTTWQCMPARTRVHRTRHW